MKKKINQSIFFIKRILPIIAILLSFSACKKKRTENDAIYKMDYKQAILDSRRELNNHLMTSFTPGISVSVSVDGEFVYSEGIGVASKELNVPTQRNTRFRIGNTSQIFTTYLIAKLQEQGLLNIDDSFYKYIPNFPKKRYDFTLRMLANQVAGFPETTKNEIIENRESKSLKAYVSKYENDSLVYEPNTYLLKSDYSIALLGILAEDITKKKYDKLVHEMILDTLHLENTSLDNPLIITPNRSEYYSRDYIARLINAPEVNLFPAAPAIGFLSTADDLNKASQLIFKPGFLTQESINLFNEPYKLSSGQNINKSFGWLMMEDREGRKLIGQIGNTIGGRSAIVVYPEQKLVVSMCSNLGDEIEELPVLKIANIFLEHLDPKEKVEEK